MKQFSQRVAIIHWLTLLLFIAALYLGHTLDEMKSSADKLSLYRFHFLLGDAVLLLTLLRVYFIRRDGKPAPVSSATPLLNKLAVSVHHLLYVLLIALPVSGTVMLLSTGLLDALKANDASKMPDLEKFTVHEVHGVLVGILFATVALHVIAALYHQFLLKDNLLRRIMIKRLAD